MLRWVLVLSGLGISREKKIKVEWQWWCNRDQSIETWVAWVSSCVSEYVKKKGDIGGAVAMVMVKLHSSPLNLVICGLSRACSTLLPIAWLRGCLFEPSYICNGRICVMVRHQLDSFILIYACVNCLKVGWFFFFNLFYRKSWHFFYWVACSTSDSMKFSRNGGTSSNQICSET